MRELGGSALFAARFRENAARALLFPRRRPGSARRSGRSAKAQPICCRWPRGYGSFPIVLETYRECLRTCSTCRRCATSCRGIERREIARGRGRDAVRRRRSPRRCCSPTSRSFIYEGDAPLAERRAQALSLDREQLRELLGDDELRELLDPDALAEVEALIAAPARPPGPDGLHDWLRRVGDLSAAEIERRRAASTGAGAPAAGGAAAHRRRGAPDRRRGRRPLPRRRRRAAAAGAARRLPGAGRPRAARPRRPLRAHARPVPRRGSPPPGSACRCSGCSTSCGSWRPTAPSSRGAMRPGGAGRGVVRRRRAAAHPARLAGPPASRGGGRARRDAGALPAALAGRRRRRPRRPRPAPRRAGAAAGRAPAGRDPGAGRAGPPGHGLPAGAARRALRRRRGRVVRGRRRTASSCTSATTRRCSARRSARSPRTATWPRRCAHAWRRAVRSSAIS